MRVPALDDIAKDEELTGAPTRVYLRLLGELSEDEDRPVRGWFIAQQMRMRENTVGRALRLLTEKGYLLPGPLHCPDPKARVARMITRTYRIVHDRRSPRPAPLAKHSA